MKLISVNIGQERSIENAKASGKTGIYKLPAVGPVQITSYGIPGDVVYDTKHHGGLDQAVYIYGALDYAWWSNTLGWEVPPGTFGENLTVSNLESALLSIGDILHMGEVVLQVTAPRIPCTTLAARMNDPSFIKRFQAAERPGLYCRVLHEGKVQAGDPVSLEPYIGERVTVLEMFRDFYEPDLTEAGIRRYLGAPIACRSRVDKEKQYQKFLAQRDGGMRA